jgi:hypothetical protein
MTDTIVILANSAKHKLHCVAGKSVKTGRWVRLVGDAEGAAITREQASMTNHMPGNWLVKPLQKIVMTLGPAVPLMHQPENYICEPGWVQNYSIRMRDLPTYVDTPQSLWGEAPRIGEAEIAFGAQEIDQSLYLVKVEDLELYKPTEQKSRVTFRYNNIEYDLPATCTNFNKIMSGEVAHDNYVVVSLGENHKGFHYKIIATIL